MELAAEGVALGLIHGVKLSEGGEGLMGEGFQFHLAHGVSSLFKVENLLHVGVKFAVRPDAEFYEAGLGVLPPLLCMGTQLHFRHIGIVVFANIFKVGKNQILMAEDGIVPQVAVVDGFQNFRPGIAVEGFVLIDLFGLQTAQLSENNFAHWIASRSHSRVHSTMCLPVSALASLALWANHSVFRSQRLKSTSSG